MKHNIYRFNELAEQTSVSQEELKLWEEEKLLSPLGRSDDQEPFFGGEQLEQIQNIQKLLDLGYGIEDIQKIIRKVGLPNGKEPSHPQTKESQYLTVGSLADNIGVSPRTIKHWEEKGIIEPDMRSQGGFRLYSDYYIFLCELIKDLQLFGYSLEEIKVISDYFRLFMKFKENPEEHTPEETEERLNEFLDEIERLFEKTRLLKQGINRWEELVKKRKKEILILKSRNQKRMGKGGEK